jgi:hypothetical protein
LHSPTRAYEVKAASSPWLVSDQRRSSGRLSLIPSSRLSCSRTSATKSAHELPSGFFSRGSPTSWKPR